jgi:hypothetical protein
MEAGGRTAGFLDDLNTWKALNGTSDVRRRSFSSFESWHPEHADTMSSPAFRVSSSAGQLN